MTSDTTDNGQIYLAAAMQDADVRPLLGGAVAVYSHPAPLREKANEDAAAVLVSGDRAVLAVADGIGGLPAGQDAASQALGELRAAIERAPATGGLREAILDGLEAANRRVVESGAGAGTTLAAVEIGPDGRARSYHVGDAAVLVVGQRGRMKHLTVAHSPVGYAFESGLMDEDEAFAHENRHFVSNMIGSPEMKIEIGPVMTLAARDTVLVASDGLFDNLRLEEITEAIRKGPLPRVAREVARVCRARMVAEQGEVGKPDDLTFVLFRPR